MLCSCMGACTYIIIYHIEIDRHEQRKYTFQLTIERLTHSIDRKQSNIRVKWVTDMLCFRQE